MTIIKHVLTPLCYLMIIANFSNCAGSKKIEDKAPLEIKTAHFEKWVSGVSGGGNGYHVFVEVEGHTVKLDSIYFRGLVAPLVIDSHNDMLYIGRLINETQHRDIIMHGDAQKEYGNQLPKKVSKAGFPFELDEFECVISYADNNKIKYFRIEKLVEKQSLDETGVPMIKQ